MTFTIIELWDDATYDKKPYMVRKEYVLAMIKAGRKNELTKNQQMDAMVFTNITK